MTPEARAAIAKRGGIAAHVKGRAHTFTTSEAKAAGAKGGRSVAKDRKHMSAIGKRGGFAASRVAGHMAAIGRKGGRARSKDV